MRLIALVQAGGAVHQPVGRGQHPAEPAEHRVARHARLALAAAGPPEQRHPVADRHPAAGRAGRRPRRCRHPRGPTTSGQLRLQVTGHVVQVAVADPGGLDPDPDLPGPAARRARRPRGVSGAPISRSTAAFIEPASRGRAGRAAARPAAARAPRRRRRRTSRPARRARCRRARANRLAYSWASGWAKVMLSSSVRTQSNRPHGYGSKSGNSRAIRSWTGWVTSADTDPVAAPLVGGEPVLLGHEVVEPAPVGGVRTHRDQALAADVLVHPQRPAGRVPRVEVELVGEDAAQPRVLRLVAGVDRSELPDQDGSAGRARVRRPLQELLLGLLAAVVRAAPEAGRHVVVQGVDGVVERLVEDVELGRVGVAVEEQDVVGVHRADRRDQPLVEGPDDAAGLVRRARSAGCTPRPRGCRGSGRRSPPTGARPGPGSGGAPRTRRRGWGCRSASAGSASRAGRAGRRSSRRRAGRASRWPGRGGGSRRS